MGDSSHRGAEVPHRPINNIENAQGITLAISDIKIEP
jgi:hypothetical protein